MNMKDLILSKNVYYNKKLGFYDTSAHTLSFYENDYLLMHPNMHQEDMWEKYGVAKKVLDFLIGFHDLRPKVILDVGAGSGKVLSLVLDYVGSGKVTGVAVDISASILKGANDNQSKIIRVRADAQKLPLQKDSVDLLYMLDVVEHTEKPSIVITEALRVADYVAIKVPLEISLYTTFRGGAQRLKQMEEKYGHIQHFDRDGFLKFVDTKMAKVVFEDYVKIPNRNFVVNFLQELLLKIKAYRLYRWCFGGFLVVVLRKK